jgi:hypothetical protein
MFRPANAGGSFWMRTIEAQHRPACTGRPGRSERASAPRGVVTCGHRPGHRIGSAFARATLDRHHISYGS